MMEQQNYDDERRTKGQFSNVMSIKIKKKRRRRRSAKG